MKNLSFSWWWWWYKSCSRNNYYYVVVTLGKDVLIGFPKSHRFYDLFVVRLSQICIKTIISSPRKLRYNWNKSGSYWELKPCCRLDLAWVFNQFKSICRYFMSIIIKYLKIYPSLTLLISMVAMIFKVIPVCSPTTPLIDQEFSYCLHPSSFPWEYLSPEFQVNKAY